jgi:predicted DNA-binding protein (MmcQ/YjbR family)
MVTAEEALEKMREICLSLSDTREGHHFGETAFYVSNKLFATCGEKHGVCEITFGLEPDHAAALVESDPRFKPYPRDRRGVVLDAANVKSWTEVKALILESYELQKPKRKPAKKSATSKRTRR